jgi:hypothetical protein
MSTSSSTLKQVRAILFIILLLNILLFFLDRPVSSLGILFQILIELNAFFALILLSKKKD